MKVRQNWKVFSVKIVGEALMYDGLGGHNISLLVRLRVDQQNEIRQYWN